MNKHELGTNEYRLLAVLTVGFVFWLCISLILILSNAFFTPLILIAFGAMVAFGAYSIYTKKLYRTISREFIGVASAAIILGAIIAFITVPSIFSGRDQGSYSAAAIHLVQNHKLAFSTPASDAFFNIHGPGKALNFPGFNYTADGLLTTQFPLGYIAWIASCFALFGLLGLSIANAFTTALFLIAFYFLIRLFASRFYATWGFLIAVTSLPVVWSSKITLSENLALTLFTLLALNLIVTFKEKSSIYPLLSLAIASFFVFTRIEGIAFFVITLIMLSFSEKARVIWKSRHIVYTIFPIMLFFALFIRSLFVNLPFYKTIAKAGLRTWHGISESCIAADCIADKSLSLWGVFWPYGLIPVFIIGGISILIFFKHKNKLTLIPFLLALPTFFYLFQPSISNDHPWMLRRFIFSIYPSLLFSAIIGISLIQEFLSKKYTRYFLFKRRSYAIILLATLLLSQLPFALQYATFSENKDLLKQTQTLAQHFSDKDLVLVDRLATGDAWSMLPEPLNLFGVKNAVYFFNPEDFVKLNTKAFKNTYLIVSEKDAERYVQSPIKQLTPIATYDFTSDKLVPSTENALPQKIHETTASILFKVE